MIAELLAAPRRLLALGLGMGVASFATALISEHGFGWIPCELCLWQRWPYLIGLPMAAAALLLWRRAEVPARGIAGLAAGAFVVGVGIAVMHTGVEFGWWDGVTACSQGLNLEGSTEDLLAQIREAPVVRCDERLSYLFGLSMTNWNLLASAGIASCFGLAALGGVDAPRRWAQIS